jgi:PAS domain S-box-containing protein
MLPVQMILACTFRQLRGWLLAVAFAPLLVALPREAASAPAPMAVDLLLPGPPSFRYAGYYAAVWRGYLAEEGLTVAVRHVGAAPSVVEAVMRRPAIYGVGGTDFLLARLEGRPVVMVAAILQETDEALTVREPGTPLSALAGKRLGLRAPPESAALRLMLMRAGLAPGRTEWVELPASAPDAAQLYLEAWQTGVRPEAIPALRPADHGVAAFYGDSLFTTEAELAYHPHRVRALRRAVLRGWDYALKNPAAIAAAMQEQRQALGDVGPTAQLLREAELIRGLVKPSMVSIGAIDRVRVREMAEALVELGLAPHTDYLENFVYAPLALWVPRWVYWAGGLLGVVAAAAGVVLIFNLRLQRRVAERTDELRRSEERVLQVFEHAPVAIVEQDYTAVQAWLDARRREGVTDLAAWLEAHPDDVLALSHAVRPVQANEVALRSVGATDLAAYARHMTQLSNASMLQAFREQLLALWTGERERRHDVVFHQEDGTEGDALLQWTVPLVEGAPDLERVLLVSTDVTALRRAEQRMRESEERFRTLFESAIEGVYESTPADGIVICNPAMARMFGCESAPEMQRWARSLGADHVYVDPQRRSHFLAALAKAEVVLDFESEIHCADGTRKWIAENVRAVRDGGGQLVRIQGFVTDISERKRFEQVLAEERERLAVTLRAMKEGVITTDSTGVILYLNETAEHLTGWTDGAAIGRPLADVCVLRHERSRVTVAVPIGETLRGERVVDLPAATQLVDRHEVPRLVEGRCAPVHDAHSRPIGMVMVIRDVAERSRLEAEMVRNSKLESLGVLAGGIAHDFNNLLTVILGNVTLAQLDRSLPASAARWLKDAETASVRARELTRQLLTFAKGGDPVRTTVQLAEVVREAANFALHGSPVKCEFVISSDLWPADVDKGQIGQVVQNLVINAVQAMPDGGVVQIRLVNEDHEGDPVRAIAAGSYLRLEIADEGSGIKPDHLSRIFDPYFTTKSTGSGLGLAMVYSIVKKHEGHVEVDSELGRGTTFRILLPASPAAKAEATKPEAHDQPLAGRVLFMDDQESICRMAATLLERLGFQVTAVRDGADVVREYTTARAEGRPFDVVLMDLTVPGGMGGREAMEELRRLDPQVRAIVSSGYSSDPVLANYRAHGFRGRVAKPYRASDLAKALRDVLAEKTDAAPVV